MEKSVSSLKIFNVVICVIILVVFAVLGTRVNVHAADNNEIIQTEGLN